MIRDLPTSRLGPVAGLVAGATIVAAVILGPGTVRLLRLIAGGVGICALILAFLPIRTLLRHGKPSEGMSYLHTTEVVDVGPYSVVRHPQYLAYVLFMLTFALLAQNVVVTVLASLASVLLYWSAVAEERECVIKLGRDYEDYVERVPRFNLVAGALRWWGSRLGGPG